MTGQDVLTLDHPDRAVGGLQFSPDGRWLAATVGWVVRTWGAPVDSSAPLFAPESPGMLGGLRWSPDSKQFLSPGPDQTVKVWDATTGLEAFTLPGRGLAVAAACFSSDGRRIAILSQNVPEVNLPAGAVPNPARLADMMLTGIWDQTLRVWEGSGRGVFARTARSLATLDQAFSPDGLFLAEARGNPFDAVDPHSLPGPLGEAVRAALAKDPGKLRVPGTVVLSDARNGEERFTLRGHTRAVVRIAFSPDSRHLASAGCDGVVKLWDVAAGKELFTLQGHTAIVASVSFSGDGRRLASSSQDGTIKIWDVAAGGLHGREPGDPGA